MANELEEKLAALQLQAFQTSIAAGKICAKLKELFLIVMARSPTPCPPLEGLAKVTHKHGLHFPEDRFYSLGGVPSRDILAMLCEEQGRQLDRLAVSREKEEAYLPFLPTVKPIDIVVEVAEGQSR